MQTYQKGKNGQTDTEAPVPRSIYFFQAPFDRHRGQQNFIVFPTKDMCVSVQVLRCNFKEEVLQSLDVNRAFK